MYKKNNIFLINNILTLIFNLIKFFNFCKYFFQNSSNVYLDFKRRIYKASYIYFYYELLHFIIFVFIM